METNQRIVTDTVPGGKSARTAPRLEKLLATAAELMAAKGFADTSIRDVAQASGLSLGGLYYYFKNKEDLLFLIQEKTFSSLLERQENVLADEQDPRPRLEMLVHNHLEHFTSHFNELKVCTFELETLQGDRFGQVESLRKRYYHGLEQVVAALMDRPRGTALVRRRTLFLFGMLNWIFMWYDPGRDGSPAEVGKDMVDMVVNGLARSPASGPGELRVD